MGLRTLFTSSLISLCVFGCDSVATEAGEDIPPSETNVEAAAMRR